MLKEIPLREVLHFLGWRGTPVEKSLLDQIRRLSQEAISDLQPRVALSRFAIGTDGGFVSSTFYPDGQDVRAMLASCHEAVLMAATLGSQSERMLLRMQSRDAAQALLLDAVLSAAIEAVCDAQEEALRCQVEGQGLYLTDRFSPGYGDMPVDQTREICEVLRADRAIGLTVSQSGIMIPRKSVTAVMGISRTPVRQRESGCEVCNMRDVCALSRKRQA